MGPVWTYMDKHCREYVPLLLFFSFLLSVISLKAQSATQVHREYKREMPKEYTGSILPFFLFKEQ